MSLQNRTWSYKAKELQIQTDLPNDSGMEYIPDDLVVLEPTARQMQKMEEAIEVMVGRVLAEYEKNHPN